MAEIAIIGKDGAEELHEFAHPIWTEVFGPMIAGGPEETERIFESWQSAESIRRAMDDGFVYGYLIDGDRKAGYLAVRIEGEKLFISKCYLVKEERGKGLGSEMLGKMLEYGREHGCSSAYLHVNTRNLRAIAAYERNGFRKQYREIAYLGDGFSTDDYIMSREIRDVHTDSARRGQGAGMELPRRHHRLRRHLYRFSLQRRGRHRPLADR